MNTTIAPIDPQRALAWAAAGWRMFPCVADPDRPGKLKPRADMIGWGHINGPASCDPDTVAKWCADPAVVTLGTPTGAAFGRVVLDLDEKNGKSGSASMAAAGYRVPADTLQWNTLNDGRHVVFAAPTDGTIVPSDSDELGEGIDRRGEGGYVHLWPVNGLPHRGTTAGALPAWLTVAPGAAAAPDAPRVGLTDAQLSVCVMALDPSQFATYDAWARIGMALHHESEGSDTGRALFDWLSQQPGAGEYAGARVIESKWRSFGKRNRKAPVTLRSYLAQVPQLAHLLAPDPSTAGFGGAALPPGAFATLAEYEAHRTAQAAIATAAAPVPPVPMAPAALALRPLDQFISDNSIIEFAIDDLLRRAWLYAMTAPTGAGKSAVAAVLALIYAKGGLFGPHQCNPGPVVYIAGENPDDVRARTVVAMERLHIPADVARSIHILPQSFDLAARAHELIAEIERVGASLVIVDTDAAVSLGSSGESSENDNALRMGQAKKYRELTRCKARPTVIALCHPIKRPQSADDCIPRGAGAFLNEIDGNLRLWRDGDVADLTSDPNKFRGAPVAMRFRSTLVHTDAVMDTKGRRIPVPYYVVISEAEASQEFAQAMSAQDRLLVAVLDYPRASLQELAHAAGIRTVTGQPDKTKTRRLLFDLADAKAVKSFRGKWQVTPAGKVDAERIKADPQWSANRFAAPVDGAPFVPDPIPPEPSPEPAQPAPIPKYKAGTDTPNTPRKRAPDGLGHGGPRPGAGRRKRTDKPAQE